MGSDVASPRWDDFRETAIGAQLLDREIAVVDRVLAGRVASPRVLDLCSCTGRISLPLRDAMASLVASDIDRDSLRILRRRSEDTSAVAADGATLPFADGSFDVVIAIQCLRYFDRAAFLEGCHRVLRAGGSLVIQAVNRNSYKRRAKELIRPSRRRRETGTVGTRETLRSIERAGFAIHSVCGYNWLPVHADAGRFADSRFIAPATSLTTTIGLERLHRLSPWILVEARKRD